MIQTCTRRLEFDAAHRITLHESKCRHLHGHRYVADFTCEANKGRDSALDALGRVIDFGVIKQFVGTWVDEHLDHGTILNLKDVELLAFLQARSWRYAVTLGEPTAENIAKLLYDKGNEMLRETAVNVVGVRLYETPNCWADYGRTR